MNGTCPESDSVTPGNYGILFTDARGKGARIHSISFGAFNVATGTIYDPSTRAIDDFLSTDANRDYMMFIAAGNNGSATTGTVGYGAANTLSNEAAAKNAIVVGANYSGRAAEQGTRAYFSSIGPAPNGVDASCPQGVAGVGGEPAASNCGRVKPDVMAPGMDGGVGLAESFNCISGDIDQMAPIECLNLGGNSGTSFSTPNAAGAGALIRDYFASGLYPDGTSGNSNNESDRRPRISGALVKSLILASADHMDGGGLNNDVGVPNYDHRFNHEQGYGYINLRNVLPLTIDPATPFGLVVKDGGCPTGVTNCPDDLPGLVNPLGSGSTAAEFTVLSSLQQLRVLLAWIEPTDAVGSLRNNLDLEVRYCGPDASCSTTGGLCTQGPGQPNSATACTTDAGCPAGQVCNMDRVWYGNIFSEDVNDDGIEDYDLDGSPGLIMKGSMGHWHSEGAWSLANNDPGCDGTAQPGEAIGPHDARNNNEGVFLSPDPEADGTDALHNMDNQVYPGKWQVGIVYRGGLDAQKYALVLAGAVVVDSSIRIDTSPISCNGEVSVVVNEVPKAPASDPVCNTGSCANPTAIANRVKIVVKTPGGNVADQDVAPALTKETNAFSFKSVKLPVSTLAPPITDDKVLLAAEGYTVIATYDDQDCSADGTTGCQGTPAETIQKTSQATFDCTPYVDFYAIGQPGRNAPVRILGGCDTDRYFDNQEVFTYLVQFGNLEDSLTLDDITVTLRAVVPDGDNSGDPGRLNNAPSPYVSVMSGSVFVDSLSPGYLETVGFTIVVSGAPGWASAPSAPPEVEMVVGITSTKTGKTAPSLRGIQAPAERQRRDVPLLYRLPDGRYRRQRHESR